MRHHVFVALMQDLSNALENDHYEVLEMPATDVLREIVMQTGGRQYYDVPHSELVRAIERWQEKHE